jgi:hypothetical protein
VDVGHLDVLGSTAIRSAQLCHFGYLLAPSLWMLAALPAAGP